ncbi:MAG: hypothetical protein ACLSF2_03180 [Butyricicoccus sp.]
MNPRKKMYEDMEQIPLGPECTVPLCGKRGQLGRDAGHPARDIQRAARRSAAEHEAAAVEGAAAPRTRMHAQTAPAPVSTGRSRMSRTAFEKLAERPGMAVGMAVGVIAVISLLLVGILMITGGSDKSEKIIVPDLIGRNIDEVMADPDITDNFTVKEATERQNRPSGR